MNKAITKPTFKLGDHHHFVVNGDKVWGEIVCFRQDQRTGLSTLTLRDEHGHFHFVKGVPQDAFDKNEGGFEGEKINLDQIEVLARLHLSGQRINFMGVEGLLNLLAAGFLELRGKRS